MPYLFDDLDAVEASLRRSPFGLITDVDGTISRIAPSPGEARVDDGCRQQLSILVKRISLVAVISGRPAAEARDMLGIDGVVYIGNHGLERLHGGNIELVHGAEEYPSMVAKMQVDVERLIRREGVFIENKGSALAIHYRNCNDTDRARGEILHRLGELDLSQRFSIVEGRMVIELRPLLDIDKGTAVEKLIEDFQLQGGVYMGDDISDIDAFRAARRRGLLAVSVASDEAPPDLAQASDYAVNGVAEVARFLKWLASAFPASVQ